MTQIWIVWALVAGLIVFEVRNAFIELSRHKEAWMLAVHCVLLTAVAMLVVQASLMVLQMRYLDRPAGFRLMALKDRVTSSASSAAIQAPRRAKQAKKPKR